MEERETTCCYARSDKNWITDPQGIDWETFLTTGESTVYGSDPLEAAEHRERGFETHARACCAPARNV